AIPNGGLLIGRAPNAEIVLTEPEVGWRHCQIRQQRDRFLVSDLRTSVGTYVNGIRSAERWLEDRDQIGIGKTILMFRSGEGAETEERATSLAADTKPVLLASCSLLFLFRALAASLGEQQSRLLTDQILRLVSDLIPAEEGLLLLASNQSELLARYHSATPPYKADFEQALSRVCKEGAFEASQTRMIGVPLYLDGAL